MKLDQLLKLTEETTSSAVATHNVLVKNPPLKRDRSKGFLSYALNDDCVGCKIIKNHAFASDNATRDLTCTYCGTVHKAPNKKKD